MAIFENCFSRTPDEDWPGIEDHAQKSVGKESLHAPWLSSLGGGVSRCKLVSVFQTGLLSSLTTIKVRRRVYIHDPQDHTVY